MSADEWASLRDAVPSFAPVWAKHFDSDREDPGDTGGLLAFAHHLVEVVAWQHPHELVAMFDALEDLYALAAVTGNEALENRLTVGLLEDILHVADEEGLDLRKIAVAISGERSKAAWRAALAYVKPDLRWDDVRGLVPIAPLPTPVGTVLVHRGWADAAASRFRVDVRLLGGELRAGHVLRSRISAGHYFSGHIAEVRRRSPDLPDEYEVAIRLEHAYQFEAWENWFQYLPEEHWQIARPAQDLADV